MTIDPAGRFICWVGRGNPLLGKALLASVGIHLVLLAVRFVPAVPHPVLESTPLLELTLVNARSGAKPHTPQALAQVNLDGGGEHQQGRRQSPLPASATVSDGNTLETAEQTVARLEAEQRRLLASYQRSQSTNPSQDPDDQAAHKQASADRSLRRLQAEIAKEVSDYQKRPRVHHFMPSTSAYRFARYFENWRARVEKIGNQNYPEAARGKIYGTVVMSVVIDHTGALVRAQIEQTSGSVVLDRAARHIVQLAAPYPPFPPDLSDTDQIAMTRSMVFSNEQNSSPAQGGELRVSQ